MTQPTQPHIVDPTPPAVRVDATQTPELMALLEAYDTAVLAKREADDRVDQLKARLRAVCEQHLTDDITKVSLSDHRGHGVALIRKSSTRLDTARFRREQPDAYQVYSVTTSTTELRGI